MCFRIGEKRIPVLPNSNSTAHDAETVLHHVLYGEAAESTHAAAAETHEKGDAANDQAGFALFGRTRKVGRSFHQTILHPLDSFWMRLGPTARERIEAVQGNWTPERVARGHRAAVYAVATAERLGRENLTEVRIAAETEDERDPVVRLARWFDAATFPPSLAQLRPDEALARLDALDFDRDTIAAFKEVQPVIQPVGLQ